PLPLRLLALPLLPRVLAALFGLALLDRLLGSLLLGRLWLARRLLVSPAATLLLAAAAVRPSRSAPAPPGREDAARLPAGRAGIAPLPDRAGQAGAAAAGAVAGPRARAARAGRSGQAADALSVLAEGDRP